MLIIPGLVVLYLYIRFCFVITAAAVGAPYTFGDSMRATGGITIHQAFNHAGFVTAQQVDLLFGERGSLGGDRGV